MAKKKKAFKKVPKKKAIGLYIKGDLLSSMSKKETIIFFQILRIINSLEFWMRLHLRIKKEQNPVFGLRNRIELCIGSA